jgi:hypothetical protein
MEIASTEITNLERDESIKEVKKKVQEIYDILKEHLVMISMKD